MLAARQEHSKRGECLGQQGRSEHGQGLILSLGKSVKQVKCHIFGAEHINIFIKGQLSPFSKFQKVSFHSDFFNGLVKQERGLNVQLSSGFFRF